MEHESDGDTNCNRCARYNPKRTDKVTEGHGNKSTSRDHPNHSNFKIGQYTEKSPGDLRRLDVT